MGAEVDGEITIPQSFPLYKQRKIQLPLHKGALGAAAPVQQYGGCVHGGKAGRALSERPYIHAGGAEVEREGGGV